MAAAAQSVTPAPATPAVNRRTATKIRTCTTAVLAGLGAIVAIAGPCAGIAAASPGAPAASGSTTGADLADVLLSPAMAGAVLEANSMQLVGSSATMADSSAQVAPAQCVSAWGPGEQQSYAGSGYTGVQTQVLANAGGAGPTHVVNQTVVSFPASADAKQYLTRAAASWVDCANRDIDYKEASGDHKPWTLGKPAIDPKKTVIEVTQAAKDGSSACERAITMKTNIVIDVLTCTAGADPTGQGVSLAETIVGNMPYSI